MAPRAEVSSRLGELAFAGALVLVGCQTEQTAQPTIFAAPESTSDAASKPDHAETDPAETDPESRDGSGDGADSGAGLVEAKPYTPPSSLGPVLETRRARLSRAVYTEPALGSELRGRVNHGDTFHVYDRVEAPDCKQAWAQVAEAGWVCLDKTEPDDAAPPQLPILAVGERVPFIYARHRQHSDPNTPAIDVYAHRTAFNRGDAPIETLPAYGSYAFTRSIANHGKRVLETSTRRVVAAADLRIFKPSEFAGETLTPDSVPAGLTLAWAVDWKTSVHAEADPEAPTLAAVPYHAPLLVKAGTGVIGADGARWFEVPEHPRNPAPGWIRDHDVQRFLPVSPPTPILTGQITVDVDLAEQVLSVWREDKPVFATLISSGKPGDQTPIGLYRLEGKWAYGKMSSLSTAPDPYYVDAVPWAMYFDGRYALHAAYWHDKFGHRLSHGCVNLSPSDAKLVFDLVSPALPGGWLVVYEHERDPGSLLRIRDGAEPVPDERTPFVSG